MKKQKLFSDLMTVAGGIFKSIEGAKDYSKMKLKDKISVIIEDMNFMKKVELEEMRKMIIESRSEIDLLRKKLLNIDKNLNKMK